VPECGLAAPTDTKLELTVTSISNLDAFELAKKFRLKELSPVEAATDALDRAEQSQPAVNAFATIDRHLTLEMAKASEARWMAGAPQGPFDGVTVTLKDNVSAIGWPTRKGSALVSAEPGSFDAPATVKCRDAGLVILGITTMPEYGWIGLSTSYLYGHTRNPWNVERTAGGSSSGAAVCAALGIGRFHFGNDGLGSIRIPASFCGVPGIKPTFGLVPNYPLSVMNELAHVGPIAPTVSEVAACLSIMSGVDDRDPTAWNTPAPDFGVGLNDGIEGLRVAFSPRLGCVQKISPAVERQVAEAVRALESLGAIVELADPDIADGTDTAWAIWDAGASLALSAYDSERRNAMDPGLQACAERGEKMKARDLVEATTTRRTMASIAMAKFHERFDLLVTPTMPTGAIPLGADLPPAGFAGQSEWGPLWTDWSPFTAPFNVTQQPAGTVPCGLDDDGMPIGLQFVAGKRQDALVLRAMRAFESARPFARGKLA
jgi:aspartyl-tRNA(Asn)/glutamyl-tRNA(Gln) amidotransferase subunit A